MKNDKDILFARIRPLEMFEMIEDFADGLLCYLREHGKDAEQASNVQLMMDTARQIMDILKANEIEGRVAIIILLQAAVAMYGQSLEQEPTPACPPDLLN